MFKADGRLRMIEAHRMDINYRSSRGDTVVHSAIDPYMPNVLDVLFRTPGVDWDAENDDGFTPLNLAAVTGNHKVVLELLQTGANIFHVNKEGKTVLHYASSIATSKIILDFLQWPTRRHWVMPTSHLRAIAERFSVPMSAHLIVSKFSFDRPVHDFIMHKDCEEKTFLDCILNEPTHLMDVLDHDLVRGALCACETDFFYKLACRSLTSAIHRRIFEKLIRLQLPINAWRVNGCPVLHKLFEQKKAELVSLLVHDGDVLELCDLGFTAYHHAASTGNVRYFSLFPCSDKLVLGECYVLAHLQSNGQLKQLLLKLGTDLSNPNVILYAIRQNAGDLVKQLAKDYQYFEAVTEEILNYANAADILMNSWHCNGQPSKLIFNIGKF